MKGCFLFSLGCGTMGVIGFVGLAFLLIVLMASV